MMILGIVYVIGFIVISIDTSDKNKDGRIVNLISSVIMGLIWPIVIILAICMKVSRLVYKLHDKYNIKE